MTPPSGQVVGGRSQSHFDARVRQALQAEATHPASFNVALLSRDSGEDMRARTLLGTYLAEYRKVLTNPLLPLVNPEVTGDELERMLESLAKSARAKLAELQSPPMETRPVQPLRPNEHVEFAADGRAILRSGPSVGFLGLIRQMVQVSRHHMGPGETRIFEHRLGISDGRWTQVHEDTFVRGFERFLHECRAEDESFRAIQQWPREEYPGRR